MEVEEPGPEVGAVAGEFGEVFKFLKRLGVVLSREAFKVGALGGCRGAFAFDRVEVELRLGVLDDLGDYSFKKLEVRLASSVAWAAMSGFPWQSFRASSGENGSVMPWKRPFCSGVRSSV